LATWFTFDLPIAFALFWNRTVSRGIIPISCEGEKMLNKENQPEARGNLGKIQKMP
jgi:hypothetical protein